MITTLSRLFLVLILMILSSHRRHKIYIAAIIGYQLGSEDSEELEYYNKVKEEMKKDQRNGSMGISRND